MSISTRSSLQRTTTTSTTLTSHNFNLRTLSPRRIRTSLLPQPVARPKLKRPKKTTSIRNSNQRTRVHTIMLSSDRIDKPAAGQAVNQYSQVKNQKFANYRRKSSAIRIPSSSSSGAGLLQTPPSRGPAHLNNSFLPLNTPPSNPFNRQTSFGSVPSQQPLNNMSGMTNNSNSMNAGGFSSFQFNPTAIAAAAVTLVQMIQNAAQNKELQQTVMTSQDRVGSSSWSGVSNHVNSFANFYHPYLNGLLEHQHSQTPTQMPQTQPQPPQQQHRNQMHSNRRNVPRYPSFASSSSSSNAMNMNTGFNNQQQQQFVTNYSPSFKSKPAGGQGFLLNNPPQTISQMQSQSNSNATANKNQSMPYNHRYSTRFKHARASIPPAAKDKKTAPRNSTQYIMHDYAARRAIDQECPNEQQQFSDEWNMALATNAAAATAAAAAAATTAVSTSSTNSSVMNLEMLKESSTKSTLEDEQQSGHIKQESENTVAMMSVDDDALLKNNNNDDDDRAAAAGIKLSSSI